MPAFYALVSFAFGASVGSFINVVADRLPSGRSIVRPRSFCESCKRTLTTLDLLPVISYFLLRGRCRTCGVRYPARLMVVELGTGLLFAASYVRFGLGAEFVITCIALALMVVVFVIDREHKLILNSIMAPSAAVLLVMAPFWNELGFTREFMGSASAWASMANSLASASGAFVFFLVVLLIFPRGMGAGDVKLAGVLGLLLGFPGALVGIWFGVVSGGLVGAALLLLRRKGRKDEVAYGTFLTAGAVLVLLWGSEGVSEFWSQFVWG